MKILLVGLGRWGEKHLRVLRELGVTVWVADVADARRQWAIARGVEPGHAVEGQVEQSHVADRAQRLGYPLGQRAQPDALAGREHHGAEWRHVVSTSGPMS